METNSRITRDPQRRTSKIYQPPKFEFHQSVQQDPQKNRYASQQAADFLNILKKGQVAVPPQHPLRVLLQNKDTKPVTEDIYQHPAERENESRKSITSRKLNPNDYVETTKRRDNNHIIYTIEENLKEEDISALSSLIGQDPNQQLQGLQNLLGNQSETTLQNNHTPITERAYDVPRIDATASLNGIQHQLDAVTKAHLDKALAQAQREAEALVTAQHNAIAKAQAAAEKKIYQQITLHNQGFKQKPPGQHKPTLADAYEIKPQRPPKFRVQESYGIPMEEDIIITSPHSSNYKVPTKNTKNPFVHQLPKQNVAYRFPQDVKIPTRGSYRPRTKKPKTSNSNHKLPFTETGSPTMLKDLGFSHQSKKFPTEALFKEPETKFKNHLTTPPRQEVFKAYAPNHKHEKSPKLEELYLNKEPSGLPEKVIPATLVVNQELETGKLDDVSNYKIAYRFKRHVNISDEYDYDDDLSFDSINKTINTKAPQAQALQKRLKTRFRQKTPHNHRFHQPLYKPKPKPNFLSDVSTIIPSKPMEHLSNVIVINNSNDHYNTNSNVHNTKQPHLIKKHKTIIRRRKPNVKKLYEIQGKVASILSFLY